ncbi:hypothetical protein C8J57DRAFT_149749 [Mycena rebaudengoi]|nr:hypothetical protein C8J57DRAFT_149749 [Mycena rebaudengoi]
MINVLSVAFSVFALFCGALAQTTHTVTVGVQGSFFVPSTTSAQVNDIVTFVFGGDIHTVTQTDFRTPCVPLPGGFNSGFAGTGAQFTKPTPSWDLRITNASEAIWFYCQATQPISHCASGMVGAINPPSIDMYNQFVAAAKLVNPSTLAPASHSFVPSGHGAIATNSPMPTSTSAILQLLQLLQLFQLFHQSIAQSPPHPHPRLLPTSSPPLDPTEDSSLVARLPE